MKKINSKGFALVETLIVTAFVVGIFSVMYANFYPMMGEYEKRENYDDISSIYNANLFKRLIENCKDENTLSTYIKKVTEGYSYTYRDFIYTPYGLLAPVVGTKVEKSDYEMMNENFFESKDDKNYYKVLTSNLDVEAIYLLPYEITEFKNTVKRDKSGDFDTQTKEYIDYLPNYNKQSDYSLACRIIVKYKAGENKESNDHNSGEYKFATIGVDCI